MKENEKIPPPPQVVITDSWAVNYTPCLIWNEETIALRLLEMEEASNHSG